MNVDRMLELAKHIDQMQDISEYAGDDPTEQWDSDVFALTCTVPTFFNMESWGQNLVDASQDVCGTAACIAGTACSLFSSERSEVKAGDETGIDVMAAKFLDLSPVERGRLFLPSGEDEDIDLNMITARHAAEVLRRVAKGDDIMDAWREALGMADKYDEED